MSISEPIPPRRHRRRRLTAATALAVASLLGGTAAQAATVLKIATLAPEGSGWVRALREIDAELRERSGGAVELKIYPGGVQGDEDVMIRKIRIGQLHGGGFGGTGVSSIYPEVLALEMPFLFDSYDEVDYVLEQMDPFLRKGYRDAGYVLLGWSDIGFVYLMSQRAVRAASDIGGMRVWRLQGEPITEVLFRKAGVTSVPLGIPDVLLGLQTNLVDVVYASPSAAIVLQWFTRVKYYTDLPITYSLGAYLLHSRFFDDLAPEDQRLLLEIAARHIRQHNLRSRRDNEEALEVMRQQAVVPVTPLPQEVASFQELVREATPELVGKVFSRATYDTALLHIGAFRQRGAAGEEGAASP